MLLSDDFVLKRVFHVYHQRLISPEHPPLCSFLIRIGPLGQNVPSSVFPPVVIMGETSLCIMMLVAAVADSLQHTHKSNRFPIGAAPLEPGLQLSLTTYKQEKEPHRPPLGCFRDDMSANQAKFGSEHDPARDLPVYMGNCPRMSPNQCNILCAGYTFFALQWKGECRCAEHGWRPKFDARPATECNTRCTGDSKVFSDPAD